MRIKAAIAATATVAAALTGIAAGTASADNHVGLYYNSNYAGDQAHFYSNISDFAGYVFIHGQPIKNNAASAWNYGTSTATIYFNSNYAGASDRLAPGTGQARLANTYNENASLRFS
ncbi:peptidase inhibitor family I36 protein [Kitasatospora sp. NBC_01539]|uniref:peptidase inhibitor family I36 protein n=1 Tax=Kitasatospora sp. NBC_01539 TaxID=2903577 RepID=UPI0038601CE5